MYIHWLIEVDKNRKLEQENSRLKNKVRDLEAEIKVLQNKTFDTSSEFDWQGNNSFTFGPHFCRAMEELTKRHAYAKGEIAQMLAEQYAEVERLNNG